MAPQAAPGHRPGGGGPRARATCGSTRSRCLGPPRMRPSWRSAYGGICGSDLHYWLHGAAGESILKAPLVLGHEISGTVVRAAADGTGPRPGPPSRSIPPRPAPARARYPADRPNLSPGCTYLGSAARYPHTDGAFSRYVTLPVRMLRPLPAGLDLRTAALIEPASRGLARRVPGRGRRGQDGAGDRLRPHRRAGRGRPQTRRRSPDHGRRHARQTAGDRHGRGRRRGAQRRRRRGDRRRRGRRRDRVLRQPPRPGLRHQGRGPRRHGGDGGPAAHRPAAGADLPGHHPRTGPAGSFRFNDEIDEVIAALADGSLHIDPVITHEYPFSDALHAFEVAKDSTSSGKVLLSFEEPGDVQ